MSKIIDNVYDIDSVLKLSKELNKDYNVFVSIIDNIEHISNSNSVLNNIPCSIKDNISTKGVLSTGGSNTLSNYVPFFDATVVKKLKDAGSIIIGKNTLDELGMGATGLTCYNGIVRNAIDKDRIAGGSSAGGVVAVKLGIVPFAIGSDTGDSIRKPASFNAVVGYKPTYGLVSRYGLFPFACSLDHVGVISNNVLDSAIVGNCIKGRDKLDMTTFDSDNMDLVKNIDDDISNRKLFYIKELCNVEYYKNISDELKNILSNFKSFIDKLKSEGIVVEEVSIDKNVLDSLYSSYLIISCAEASSNYSNLTGIVFGPRGRGNNISDMLSNHRSSFNTLIKRRFVIGSYVLQKENQERYYLNACRVRTMVISIMNDLFSRYDGLIMPASGNIAPYIKDVNNKINYDTIGIDNHLVIGNFGGYPSITIPFSTYNNMPYGINITGNIKNDAVVLNIAKKLEDRTRGDYNA